MEEQQQWQQQSLQPQSQLPAVANPVSRSPPPTGLDAPGVVGGTDLHSLVTQAAGESCCPWSTAGSWGLSDGCPGIQGYALLELRSHGPHLPKAAIYRPHCPEPLPPWLLPNALQAALQLFTGTYPQVLVRFPPWCTSSLSDSGKLEASLPLLQFCPISLLSTSLPREESF